VDINTALHRMRELANLADAHAQDKDALAEDAANMATVFEAIDGWLSRGGFLPHAWAKRS
jgi:hypothetical protein